MQNSRNIRHKPLLLFKYKDAGYKPSGLSQFKIDQASVSQYKIDQNSDDDDSEENLQSSEASYDDSPSDETTESFPDTESSGQPEPMPDKRFRSARMRGPALGLPAHNRRLSLDGHSTRGVTGLPEKSSKVFRSQENFRDDQQLYSRIDRRSRTSKPNFNRGLTMIKEVSPVLSTSPSTTSDVPPLASLRTTNSFQPTFLPKTNPLHGPKIVSSTPRSTGSRRREPYQMDLFDRDSYCATTDSEFEAPAVPFKETNPQTQIYYRPEQFCLPSPLARNMGINGILFLSMSLSGPALTLHLKHCFYFREPNQAHFMSYIRAELHHRSHESRNPKRHRPSSLPRRQRYEEVYMTRRHGSNRPTFDDEFKFTLPKDADRDILFITVYGMNRDDQRNQKMMGCMAFPIRQLLKKAREANADYFFYRDDSENVEGVVINNGGFFLLSPKFGEKQNLPMKNIKKHVYYNDPALSGVTSGASSFNINSPSKMDSEGSSHLRPLDSRPKEFYASTGNIRMKASGGIDDTSASSSTSNECRTQFSIRNVHRATLPSITTTTSENTSDADGTSMMSPSERRRLDYHFLCPDNGETIHGAGNIAAYRESVSPVKGPGGGSVRRAASFTFSPKGTVAKNNQRPLQMRDGDEKEKKQRFFGPISKTLSYLRNKMDTALSTTSLYPTLEEVRSWETCFDALLNNKFGCALFRQFLKKEFSDENVDFWLECEEFKNMKDGKKATTQRANEIYKKFIAEQAPREVNLDSDTRAATKAALENGGRTDTFSLAQSRIGQLMMKDSYRRFLKDRLYHDLLEELGGEENGVHKEK